MAALDAARRRRVARVLRRRRRQGPTLDTNVTCYIANGVWHHYLSTGDTGFLEELFAVVERAIDSALDHQTGTGEIAWRADDPADGALLTGSSSIYASLRCAIAAAERLGRERPDWELSLGSLAIAIAHRPDRFLDKARWAMDWYYPVLGGALRGHAAHARVAAGWSTFVVEGRGVRCVSDAPWVTAAETCECVMALDAIGAEDQARELFAWVQFLRHDDGGYWTGANFEGGRFHEDGELYPVEQPTWNSAAVVLAANALGGTGPTAGLFRGEGLPAWAHRRGAHRGRRGDRVRTRRPPRPPVTPLRSPRCRVFAYHGVPEPRSTGRVSVRRRTRREPVVETGSKRPDVAARFQTSNGAWPPSSGRSNTSWNTSSPPGATYGDQRS